MKTTDELKQLPLVISGFETSIDFLNDRIPKLNKNHRELLNSLPDRIRIVFLQSSSDTLRKRPEDSKPLRQASLEELKPLVLSTGSVISLART